MYRKIRRFLEFNSSERRVFLEAVGLLPLTAIGIRGLGFRRFYDGSRRWATIQSETPPAENSIPHAQRTARLVQLAARHGLYHGSCLEQSLALLWLLRRKGIVADLQIGVRKEGGQLQAHAWVEYLGFPLNESANVRQRYLPFDPALILRHVSFR